MGILLRCKMKTADDILQVMFSSKVVCLGCGEEIIATDKIEHKSDSVTCKNCNVDVEIFNRMVWN